MLSSVFLASTDAEGSDSWGAEFIEDAVSMFVWVVGTLALVIVAILLLHSFGRRRAAERDADDL